MKNVPFLENAATRVNATCLVDAVAIPSFARIFSAAIPLDRNPRINALKLSGSLFSNEWNDLRSSSIRSTKSVSVSSSSSEALIMVKNVSIIDDVARPRSEGKVVMIIV